MLFTYKLQKIGLNCKVQAKLSSFLTYKILPALKHITTDNKLAKNLPKNSICIIEFHNS